MANIPQGILGPTIPQDVLGGGGSGERGHAGEGRVQMEKYFLSRNKVV